MKAPIANRYALIGMALLAAALTAHLASAATSDGAAPRQTVVRFADLDLSRPADAHRLYGRIKKAAREVCDIQPSAGVDSLRIYEGCLRKAVTDAVAQVQSSEVAAIERADMRLSKN